MMPTTAPKRRRKRRIFFGLMLVLATGLGGWGVYRYHGTAPSTEIFRGITYGCEQLPDSPESGGLMHWVCADLTVPGVSLYITPMDEPARAKGFEYKLKHTSSVVSEEHLAAAVNGTLFNSDSDMIRWPGDLAVACETVVADHVVNHIDPSSYLLLWDDDKQVHFLHEKPPTAAAVKQAKWGIAGQSPMLFPGYMSDEHKPENRTAIGADPVTHRVWIACFDKASHHVVAESLKAKGAIYGIMVDGGTSVAMAIGSEAKHVRPGTVTGNWRPVATHFGFRAKALEER